MEAARANLIENNDDAQSQQIAQDNYILRDVEQITLHEAMIEVLKNCPNKTASFNFLADEIKNRKLYFRKEGSTGDNCCLIFAVIWQPLQKKAPHKT